MVPSSLPASNWPMTAGRGAVGVLVAIIAFSSFGCSLAKPKVVTKNGARACRVCNDSSSVDYREYSNSRLQH